MNRFLRALAPCLSLAFLLPATPALAQTTGQSLDAELDALRTHEAALAADNVAMRADLAFIADTVGDLAVRLSALEGAAPTPDPTPGPTPAGLVYVPPTLIDPVVVRIRNTDPDYRYPQKNERFGTAWNDRCYPPDRDVLLLMPPTVRNEGLEICGGRNVRMIGGHIVGKKGQKAKRLLVIMPPSGEFFIEGLFLDPNGLSMDAIGTRTRRVGDPWGFMLTLQNTRIVGVGNVANRRIHADILQAQGPIGTLRLERFTGRSSMNGLVLNNENDKWGVRGVRRLEMRNADFAHTKRGVGNTFLAVKVPGPNGTTIIVFGDNVWMDCFLANGTCSRYATEPIGGRGTRFDAGPPPRIYMDSMGAEGFISAGVPPAGDFAKPKNVGLNYVSPWLVPIEEAS